MSAYSPGELIVVEFPFTDGRRGKARPALVLLDTGDRDIVVARMTSKRKATPLDVEVVNWPAAGLRSSPSTIRLHKLFTVDKKQVHFRLGQLDPADRQNVAAVLAQVFAHW